MMLMAAPHRIICLAESCNKRPATCDSGKIPSAIHTTLKRALNSPSHGYLALPPVMDSLCRAISARDTAQCRISHFVAQFLRETPLSAGFLTLSRNFCERHRSVQDLSKDRKPNIQCIYSYMVISISLETKYKNVLFRRNCDRHGLENSCKSTSRTPMFVRVYVLWVQSMLWKYVRSHTMWVCIMHLTKYEDEWQINDKCTQ